MTVLAWCTNSLIVSLFTRLNPTMVITIHFDATSLEQLEFLPSHLISQGITPLPTIEHLLTPAKLLLHSHGTLHQGYNLYALCPL